MITQQVNLKFEDATEWPDRLNSVSAYAAARTVARKIIESDRVYPREIARKEGLPWLTDCRKNDINPGHGQTKQGLFLELRNGYPSMLWTMWGRWDFADDGGGAWDELIVDLLLYFDAKEYQEAHTTYFGEVGPVYALHAIDTSVLPVPQALNRDAFVSFDHAWQAWDHVDQRYQRNQLRRVLYKG